MKAIMDFKKFDFFHAFSDNQLEKLLKVTEKKTFKKGTQIYKVIVPTRFISFARAG